MERAGWCALLAFLFGFAWIDYKKKEMPLLLLGICGVTGLLVSRGIYNREWSSILGGVCVGLFLLICSLVLKESVGFADGVLFCAAGTWLGLWQNLILLFGATVLCGLFGGILLLRKKCSRKESLAFAPFVLAAYTASLMLFAS